jgi:hypothetical protein
MRVAFIFFTSVLVIPSPCSAQKKECYQYAIRRATRGHDNHDQTNNSKQDHTNNSKQEQLGSDGVAPSGCTEPIGKSLAFGVSVLAGLWQGVAARRAFCLCSGIGVGNA